MRARRSRWLALAALLATPAAQAAVDPKNPTCPAELDWSSNARMLFNAQTIDGRKILTAEGAVDAGTLERLAMAIDQHGPIDEIWLRSPGGNAQVGNAAGRLIRELGIPTRIPSGWACFSACNFVFMGGPIRMVDPGGLFIVHMFTHASDRQYIEDKVADGDAIGLIGEIEQESAMLASDDNDFLIRMGVSRKLLTEVMYAQKALEEQGADRSTRRCLTQDELHEYNVANVR